MISTKQLRIDFPEFSSAEAYSEPVVAFWLVMAKQLLNAERWGPSAADPWPTGPDPVPDRTVYDLGCELFVAHNLVLEARDRAAAGMGGIPGGGIGGPVQSKSVDKVAVSYDTQGALEADAGHWNLTTYGKRYIRLVLTMGAGPLQIC